MKKFFNDLMKTPCVIYRKAKTVRSDGTARWSNTIIYNNYCNFHSINSQKAQFADIVGERTVYLVCVPVEIAVKDKDIVEINSVKYDVVGVRSATTEFEKICEVVAYEKTHG